MNNAFLNIFVLVIGAVAGSFINVVIYRLPRQESIVFPGSHCPFCNVQLKWYENIPMFSFVLLGHRCRSCHHPISWQYPTVEVLMAMLSYALFYKFHLTASFVVFFIFTAMLLAIIYIDFQHQIIPDLISIPGIIIGFTCSFITDLISWQNSLLGIIIGGGFLYGVAVIYYFITKREGMGGGDIKLLAMLGAFLGWRAVIFIVFFSALLGSLAGLFFMTQQKKGGKTMIPYGPFLSLASIFYVLYGEQNIITDYINLIQLLMVS